MPVELKHIRDYMRDVPPPNPPAVPPVPPPPVRVPLWQHTSEQPFEITVHSIAPGAEDAQQPAAHQFELTICWRGKGKAVIGSGPSSEIDFEAGDTFAIPPGLARMYRAEKDVKPDNKPDRQPCEKVILISVRTKLPPGALTPDTMDFSDRALLKRKLVNYYYYNRVAEERCVRSRTWGRDAAAADGKSDVAKPYMHLTAYCFVPTQVNPEHYHPHSAELVICVQGEADVSTREPAIPSTGAWNPHEHGWQAPKAWVMQEGNVLLVPRTALHQYVTRGNEDLILLAMQSPHPIMHMLGPEVSTLP